ncbi:hypothetical protein EK21DRAFT_115243 [Setomelanomma holmii]|uniref:Uncharacterized protein n=1 Tax=Setomelanomma holmii TaxID=210430 RepID=A0A9P4LHM9_9PLEO|nr:hypothetical protein EK21DRAFT_115243 [Setomelanomma holmii]
MTNVNDASRTKAEDVLRNMRGGFLDPMSRDNLQKALHASDVMNKAVCVARASNSKTSEKPPTKSRFRRTLITSVFAGVRKLIALGTTEVEWRKAGKSFPALTFRRNAWEYALDDRASTIASGLDDRFGLEILDLFIKTDEVEGSLIIRRPREKDGVMIEMTTDERRRG